MQTKSSRLVDSIVTEHEHVAIEICTNQGLYIGSLTPVTRASLEDNHLIECMTTWRNRMRTSFLNQELVTTESTRNFIVNSLLTDATRLLFIVRSSGGPVGTLGLKVAPPWVHGAGPGEKYQGDRRLAELANLLRGSREGHPMLMYYAEMSLMEWAFLQFELDMIWTAVPSDNRLALALHRSAGFKATELIPLFKSDISGTGHLVPGEVGQINPGGIYAQRIELERAEFFMKKDHLLGSCSYGVRELRAGAVSPAGIAG